MKLTLENYDALIERLGRHPSSAMGTVCGDCVDARQMLMRLRPLVDQAINDTQWKGLKAVADEVIHGRD